MDLKFKLTETSINLIIACLIAVWFIGIFWEFVTRIYSPSLVILPVLKYNYSIVCHTETEKLIEIGGLRTLTCARCTGIYFGAFLSSLCILIIKNLNISTKLLLLASIPMFLDVILYTLDIYNYSKIIALTTGLLLGSIGFIYIHDAIKNLFIKEK